MRILLALPALLLLTACAEIQTVAHRTEKLPAGAAVTVHMVSKDSGERVMRSDTPYVCRIKAMGWGATISSFSLQVIHVPTGRVLISQAGQDGNWSATQVARALQAALK